MKMLAVTLIGPKDEMEYVANQMILLGGFQPLSLDLILGDKTLRSKVKTATDNPYDELLSEMGYVWQAAGESLPEPYPVPVTKEQTYEKMRAEVRRVTEKLRLWAERKSSFRRKWRSSGRYWSVPMLWSRTRWTPKSFWIRKI